MISSAGGPAGVPVFMQPREEEARRQRSLTMQRAIQRVQAEIDDPKSLEALAAVAELVATDVVAGG